MQIYKKISVIFYFLAVTCLFSCGLANYDFGLSGDGETFQDSSSDDSDTSSGVFNSPSGPLKSENTCFDNESCVELCDSMLKRFSDQKECYDHTETEVQSFRDIYNLIAIGDPKKLGKVRLAEMENFLEFGPVLWTDAIYGFERGRKEDCTEVEDPADPRNIEDCKFDTYYKQVGYWSSGAAAVLEWIARNDWLAKLIVEYDKDFLIMKSLLDVLAHGGGKGLLRSEEPSTICPPNEVEVEVEDEDILFLDPAYKNQYIVFKTTCLFRETESRETESRGTESYFTLSVKERNKNSVNLGHLVLEELCENSECIRDFYCAVSGDQNNSGSVIYYMKEESGINGWDNSYNTCTD